MLFVTNQSGTNIDASKQESTALPPISLVLYLSGQYFGIKESSQTTLFHIS